MRAVKTCFASDSFVQGIWGRTVLQLSRPEIQKLVSINAEAVAAIRDAYVSVTDGRASVPPVGYLDFPQAPGDCHIKYGYIAGDSIFSVKIATGFYDNPSKGLPSSNGIIIALSARTGQVVALLNDEGWLTDMRTGIGGAVATFALCREDSERFGIVGTGTQARSVARAIAVVAKRPVNFVVWGRSTEKAERMVADLRAADMLVSTEADLETLCRNCDVVVTTTPSTEPLVRSEWIAKGMHVTAIGADAPGKQELDADLVGRADVVVADLARQSLGHGEFENAFAAGLIKESDCLELGEVLSGKARGRTSADQITVVDLTGLATQDIAIVRTVLESVPGLKL